MPKLHETMSKYGVGTYAPNYEITDEEAIAIEESCETIRRIWRGHWLHETGQIEDGQYKLVLEKAVPIEGG